MGISDDILADWHAAQAALLWQVDLGIDDWLLDAPLNRYDLPEPQRPAPAAPASAAAPAGRAAPAARNAAPPASYAPAPEVPKVDVVAEAAASAAQCRSLDDLRAALERFEHCEIRRGARNLVFADGVRGAPVLILTEAPSAEEDREGRLFVGTPGVLLDQMFAAIGLSRQAKSPEAGLYITSVLPWRPPGNRAPEPDEIAMLRPFVERHIRLAAPRVIVVMGAAPLQALTGAQGFGKLRGTWMQALDLPVLPMAHPRDLLRNPIAKREAWADLLALEARLQT